MPEPYQTECRRQLFSLAGVLDIPAIDVRAIPHTGTPQPAMLSKIMRECADVIDASAPALDGTYDSDDCIFQCNRLIDELFDVVEAAYAEAIRIRTATGAIGSRPLPAYTISVEAGQTAGAVA